jgi:hypothetical protein
VITELGGPVFEFTHDLIGDLFSAKNAGVTGGRAFSGGAAARVVGRRGGGRDGAPRPFSRRAAMIAHARVSGCFGMVGPACQRHTKSPAVNACGARGFGSAAPPDL